MGEKQVELFDGSIESTDWRHSAAIVGLIKYLRAYQEEAGIQFKFDEDVLRYQKSDITKERYLEFVERQYPEDMHHCVVEGLLEEETLSENSEKEVNARLIGNTVMKKYFSKVKYSRDNKDQIREIIKANRTELIRETFRNKANLYANFANPNQLFHEQGNYARLVGYYIDGPKKGKSASYNFDTTTFQSKDSPLFDFIPFAFTIGRESIFINANSSIKELITTNRKLQEKVLEAINEENHRNPDIRKAFFKAIIEAEDFLNYDVEIIVKDREKSFFETLILRKESIMILKQLKERYKSFCFSHKQGENYINVQKEVTNAIVNLYRVDKLIELFLKIDNQAEHASQRRYGYLISNLVHVNVLISIEKERQKGMYRNIKAAKESAKKITRSNKITDNKIKSYRNKLSSALTFKDYDRFCMVLTNLATYTDSDLDFAYDLFMDFEKNKDIAYTFVMALGTANLNEEDK